MAWELTDQEQNALPEWARRGVMPHHPVQGHGGQPVCNECETPWGLSGCDTVVLAKHYAQALVALAVSRSDAAALREEKLVELALHAEEMAALRAALTLTPEEVASLADVLRYCQRVVAGTPGAPARFSDLELSELALRTAVLAKAMERAGKA